MEIEMAQMIPLFGPIPGGMEMMVILLIAVLLFGANKIPKLARSTGEAMGEFKKGRQEIEEELNEMSDPDVETVESDVSSPDADTNTDTNVETNT
ncbi:Sec-independent protein translocase subunit TatA/TatB [Halorussus amylolyticus]|uniref:Sec-independent protein translocase subunit TatA/TatB n=1 Tax=Halorussus amylolyticus TaxID=1126242 RepID=UPI00104D8B7B|nr:twin-arginine translocase TatA/TatE family subunit [Halorussus amylolyticus]